MLYSGVSRPRFSRLVELQRAPPSQHTRFIASSVACRSTDPKSPAPGDEEGLAPDEDFTVSGTYLDALSPNTKLGKAVKEAVAEINHLNQLEKEVLQQADELLKKYGLKGSLFTSPGGGAAGDAMEGMSDDELMRSLTTQLTQAGMALPEETAAADSAGGDGSSSSKKQ